jgi:hypothetical protein
VDTLDYKVGYPQRHAVSPTEAWLLISDYKDIWFLFEKSAYSVFAEFPKAADLGNGKVLHCKC